MNTEAEQLWATALAQLRTLVSPAEYELWLAPVRAVQLNATALTLEFADEFGERWLHDRFAHLLCEVVTRVAGRAFELRFQVAALASPASGRKPGAPSGFNKRNTFDAFVVGNNPFAHSAALAVAQAPGEAYNPLLLFGGTGLGKTHLLQAIGAHVATRRPEMGVRCVTMEQFMQEFTAAGQGRPSPGSADNIGSAICCWWMTSSSSPGRNASSGNSSSSLARCIRRANRSCWRVTGLPTKSRGWTRHSSRVSSGAW